MPINTKKLDEFNPFDVPTISQICHELDQIKQELGESKRRQGIFTFVGVSFITVLV